MLAARYLIVFLVPLGVAIGYYGGGLALLIPPLTIFGVIPLLDIILGVNVNNPDEEEEKRLLSNPRYRWIPIAAAPVQVGLVFWGAWAFTSSDMLVWEKILFAYGVGLSSGILGINISHELIHKVNNKLEPLLGRIMLWTVLYMHWAIEHVIGHHRFVATPEDPATSRRGESFWQFLPRTVIGGFESAWRLESARVTRKGHNPYGWKNRILRYLAAQVGLLILMGWLFGAPGLLFLIIQASVAIGLLEIVNYLEHYGLERKKLENGAYEPVKPHHSWNSSNWVTNYFLFNLQRHSDHHYKPNRRYQILRHFPQAPQLPTGYAGMIVLAFFPPLWRRVMDGRAPGNLKK